MNKLYYFLFGVLPSAIMFWYHITLCDYDMNPLCFIFCVAPLIWCLPILLVGDEM